MFSVVRHRLDQLDYNQHLNQDSVELVSRLLSDLITTTTTHQQSKLKIRDLETSIKLIQNSNADLSLHNNRLQAENKELHLKIIEINKKHDAEILKNTKMQKRVEGEIQNIKYTNSVLKHQLATLHDQAINNIDKNITKITNGKIDLAMGLLPNNISRIEIDPVQVNLLQMKEKEYNKLYKQYVELQQYKENAEQAVETVVIEDERVDQLKDQIEMLNNHIQDLEDENERLEKEKMTINTTIVESRNEMQLQLRQEQDRNKTMMEQVQKLEQMVGDLGNKNTEQTITALKFKCEEADMRLQTIKIEKAEIQKQLNKEKVEKEQLFELITGYEQELDVIMAKIHEVESERAILKKQSQEYNDKLQLQQDAKNKEIKNIEVQFVKEVAKLKTKISNLEEHSEKMESKNASLLQELNSAKNSNLPKADLRDKTYTELEINDLRRKYAQTKIEHDQISHSLEELQQEHSKLQGFKELYEQVQNQLNEKELPIQKELEKMQMDLVNTYKQNEMLNGMVFDLQKQIAEIKHTSQDCNTAASETVTQLNGEISFLKNHVNELENTISELEAKKLLDKEQLEKTESTVRELQASISKERNRLVQLELDLNRQKLLVRDGQSQLQSTKTALNHSQSKSNSLEIAVRDSEKQISQQKELLDSLELERQKLVAELDSKTELLFSTQQDQTALQKTVDGLAQKLNFAEADLDSVKHELARKQNETDSLRRQLDDAKIQISYWERQVESQRKDNERLAYDLQAIANENSKLADRLSRAKSDHETLQKELESTTSHNQNMRDELRQAGDERHFAQLRVGKLVTDLENAQAQLRESIQEANDARAAVKANEKQLNKIRDELGNAKEVNAQLQKEITNVQQSESVLQREFKGLQRARDHFESECDRLAHEISQVRQLAHTELLRRQEIQGTVVEKQLEVEGLKKELKVVSELCANQENENDKLIVKLERLEGVLENERGKIMLQERQQSDGRVSQSHVESGLKARLNEMEVALRSKDIHLREAKLEVERLRNRISQLEELVVENQSDAKNGHAELDRMQKEILELRADGLEKQKVIEDILAARNQTSQTIDSKILREINETQREYQEATEELERQGRERLLDQQVFETFVNRKKDN